MIINTHPWAGPRVPVIMPRLIMVGRTLVSVDSLERMPQTVAVLEARQRVITELEQTLKKVMRQ